jgi:hypothetical protein
MSTELSIAGDQTVTFSLSATDDVGNIITDGLTGLTGITWGESSEGAIVTVVAAADGLSAQITAVGPVGVATVAVGALLPDGVTSVGGSCSVSVTAGVVSQFDLVPGAPAHK